MGDPTNFKILTKESYCADEKFCALLRLCKEMKAILCLKKSEMARERGPRKTGTTETHKKKRIPSAETGPLFVPPFSGLTSGPFLVLFHNWQLLSPWENGEPRKGRECCTGEKKARLGAGYVCARLALREEKPPSFSLLWAPPHGSTVHNSEILVGQSSCRHDCSEGGLSTCNDLRIVYHSSFSPF